MKFIQLLATSLILMISSFTRAESVSYEFSATIDSIFSYDDSAHKITHLNEGGFLTHYFKIGLPLYGHLTFDTKALLSPTDPNGASDGTSIYENGVTILSIAKQGFAYQGDNGNLSVSTGANSMFGWDQLYFSTQTSDAEYSESAGISLINYSGTTLNNFNIPNRLSLNSFDYMKLDYTWLDKTTQNQFHVFANIQALEFVSAVPEPDPRLMLLLGVLAVGSWASVKRQNKKPNHNG